MYIQLQVHEYSIAHTCMFKQPILKGAGSKVQRASGERASNDLLRLTDLFLSILVIKAKRPDDILTLALRTHSQPILMPRQQSHT